MTIHFMTYGMAACLKPGVPKDWEDDHKWSSDWENVTCSECLAGREEIKTFTLSEDGKSITCLRCKLTSHHPDDVENHYCGCCHVSHDYIWPPARAAWIKHLDRNVREDKCPHCGKAVNASSAVEHEQRPFPQEDDVGICFYCAGLSVTTITGPRAATEEEAENLYEHPTVQKVTDMIKKRIAARDKIIVFSGVDDSYRKLSDLTFPVMKAWADYHKAEFIGFLEPPKGLNPWWFGIGWGLDLLLRGYKRIIRLDADQFITNLEPWFDDIPYSGFHIGRDWGNDATEPWHVSTCGFVAHQDCIPFFKSVLEMEPEWRDKPFQEQGPLREKLRQMMPTDYVTIHPRKRFNCVPEEACPGEVPEPWKPGDFAAHLTMFTIEQRCEMIKKFAPYTIQSIKCIIGNSSSTPSGDPGSNRT